MSFKRRLKRNIVNKPLSRIKLERALGDSDYTLYKVNKLKFANCKDKKLATEMTNWRKVALVILAHAQHTENHKVAQQLLEIL